MTVTTRAPPGMAACDVPLSPSDSNAPSGLAGSAPLSMLCTERATQGYSDKLHQHKDLL
jgi:hypothetical protein